MQKNDYLYQINKNPIFFSFLCIDVTPLKT